MKNKYLQELEKIEFVLCSLCTGNCKHCSEGDHARTGEKIDPTLAADAVKRIAAEYDIKTVMVFGGEPLLHKDAVYSVMGAAKALNIPKRQVITNGYFSCDEETIRNTARKLSECGVNDLCLSVDAFHQETIPQSVVMTFAKEAIAHGIPIRLQPAWLVSQTHDNPYNKRTRAILRDFSSLGIPVGNGNVVFFEGNAKIYLSEYFTETLPENPYIEDPCCVKCISFSPNGDVLNSNAYKKDIMKILEDYTPQREEND